MVRLKDVLREKKLVSVEKTDRVSEVSRKMAGLNIGAIVVLENGELRGIFSERDLMKRVIVEGYDPAATSVEQVMSTNVATVDESASIEQAMELMHKHNCRHLPLMCGTRVVGLVSMRDLMNYELERKSDEIQQMRSYINGAS